MYEYRATLLRVIDGDTLLIDIDLGFGIWMRNQTVRLYGINAPELKTPQGPVARDWLKEQLMGWTICVQTIKDKKEKYGRWLAKVLRTHPVHPELGDKECVNDQMVAAGMAVVARY